MASLLRRALESSDEDSNIPSVEKEKEFVFYGKIKDLNVLKSASSMEHQEQYEVKIPKTEENATKGRIRIRKTVKQGAEPEYTLTCKTPTADGNNVEVNNPASKALFTQFQYMSAVGMLKDRFIFKAEGGLNWEVDVYPGPDGQYQQWCRLELEVKDFNGAIPELPIELEEVITNQADSQTPEEKAKVQTLYDTVFLRRNPFVNNSQE